MKTNKLIEKKQRWETELANLSTGERWGETRRFAGRMVENRINRRRWLIEHIASINLLLNKEDL